MSLRIAVARVDGADAEVPLPVFATEGAAGADVRANLSRESRAEGLLLGPRERALVPTGLRMAIPKGYEVQVRPRSGLALKHGLTVANAPGTIDSDYRGAVGVILVNLGTEPVRVAHGDRIAQLVVARVEQAVFDEVRGLDETARGTGGFGSTGVG